MSIGTAGSTSEKRRESSVKPPRDAERDLERPLGRPDSSKVATLEPATVISYRLDEFLIDHRRLATVCRLNLDPRPCVGGWWDDRFVPIQTGIVGALSRAREDPEVAFRERYGGESGAVRWSRFRMVLRFLDDWHLDLSASGLARGSDPMEVHEEFIAFLLQYPLKRGHGSLPRGALVRFLDELGHRWM